MSRFVSSVGPPSVSKKPWVVKSSRSPGNGILSYQSNRTPNFSSIWFSNPWRSDLAITGLLLVFVATFKEGRPYRGMLAFGSACPWRTTGVEELRHGPGITAF
jgi:hypothetical protein